MADRKNQSEKVSFPKNIQEIVSNLRNVTRTSKSDIYGMETDLARTSSEIKYDQIKKNMAKINTDKLLTSSLSNQRMNSSKTQKSGDSGEGLYDIIKDPAMMNQLQSALSGYNVQFKQLMQDYEVIKRCIPQVHKTLQMMQQNIANPDSISKNIVGIKFNANVPEPRQKEVLELLRGKYKINQEVEKIIEKYLIVSTAYIADVPYSAITKMLRPDDSLAINEAVMLEDMDSLTESGTLLEILKKKSIDVQVMSESAMGALFGENLPLIAPDIEASMMLTEAMNNIEFFNGALSYYKYDIINETVAQNVNHGHDARSVLEKLRSKKPEADGDTVVDGFISEEQAKKIDKNVTFRGCKSEFLDPARMIAFKMRDTVIGYFYVEDDSTYNNPNTQRSIMDQINSTVYKTHSDTTAARKNQVEQMVIKTIGQKLISAVSDKFLVDNMKDINIIYEFVKEHELHTKRKRVVFFHPDEIVEVRREEGSILKNSLFMAKLFILTILSNTIINATRGGDRTTYYVSTGLTTDIEGHVNKAIAAIKQGQLRYSDMGTINEVFNVVGSNVDVFIPQSVDGSRPIDAEVISGQNVDMNNDFLEFLIRNIIMSFGMPPSIVENFESVDLARTLSMSNLDAAKVFMDAQLEITPAITKHIQNILMYEFPEDPDLCNVEATFNTPSVIVREMNRDIISSVQEMADLIIELLVAEDDETPSATKKRILRYKYIRECTPTLDWDAIDNICEELNIEYRVATLVAKLTKKDDTSGY